MEKRYQVFVSSTYADLKEERSKVIQTIMESDCIPAGMEIFPAIDEKQFEFIKRIIDDCDYYLLIIGGRYGTLTEEGISYTELEYDYAIQKNIKVIAFIHSKPGSLPFDKSEPNPELREKLEEFKEKVKTNRLIKFWEKAEELPGLVALSLSKTIKTYPAIGWIRANITANPELYIELIDLRKETQELKKIIESGDKKDPDKVENLTEMESTVEIKGISRLWNSFKKGYFTQNWKLEITWNKMFSLISPYLLKRPNDKRMNELISKIFYDLTSTKKSYHNYTPIIDDQDFQTIKIQFKALGLIDVSYLKTTAGGMDLFWDLTKNGENLMINLRSIKNE